MQGAAEWDHLFVRNRNHFHAQPVELVHESCFAGFHTHHVLVNTECVKGDPGFTLVQPGQENVVLVNTGWPGAHHDFPVVLFEELGEPFINRGPIRVEDDQTRPRRTHVHVDVPRVEVGRPVTVDRRIKRYGVETESVLSAEPPQPIFARLVADC